MTAKQYLSRAYKVDLKIRNLVEQLSMLRDLSTSLSVSYSDMPGNPNKGISQVENTIIKIIEIENKINVEIDKLVELKESVKNVIDQLNDDNYVLILSMRYLCFKSWEEIANALGYTVRYVHVLHGRALREVEIVMEA